MNIALPGNIALSRAAAVIACSVSLQAPRGYPYKESAGCAAQKVSWKDRLKLLSLYHRVHSRLDHFHRVTIVGLIAILCVGNIDIVLFVDRQLELEERTTGRNTVTTQS